MKRALVLLLPLCLAACVGSLKESAPITVYDFGLPPAALEWRASEPLSNLALGLVVKSPPWFDSLNVDYRLAYEDALKPREYSTHRWAGAPAALLTQYLRQQLDLPGAAVSSACQISVELQEFSQVFETPQTSHAALRARVSLVDARKQVIAERQVAIDVPAASANATGGVKALVGASTLLAEQLSVWLVNQEKAGRLKACRNG